MKILLDTSFLLTAIRYKLDIFTELKGHELIVLEPIKLELENLINGKKKGNLEAKIALELIKRNKIKIKKTELKEADDALANENGVVATQDKKLKKRLKRIITIRQKKYLIGI